MGLSLSDRASGRCCRLLLFFSVFLFLSVFPSLTLCRSLACLEVLLNICSFRQRLGLAGKVWLWSFFPSLTLCRSLACLEVLLSICSFRQRFGLAGEVWLWFRTGGILMPENS